MNIKMLKNKNFFYFSSSQAISQLGDWIHWVALLAFVYESTKSGIAIASVSIALTVTRIIIAPIAGVIADRYERKMIMVTTNFLQSLFICFFLFDSILYNMYSVLIVVICVSILSSIYEPTKRSIIPMIVKKEEILKANSFIETIMNALWVLGPVTG